MLGIRVLATLSGDGRIAAIASLFTRAAGMEGDKDLLAKATRAQAALGLADLEFRKADYYDEDLSSYDVLFMFPDKEFDKTLIKKLKDECEGTLYIYNNIYLPAGLKKGPTIWIEQLPVARYRLNEK